MQFDVFISYSHEDKAAADAACATLEQAGIRCWIAPRDIVPGMDWSESIINAIERAKLMVLIFSGHANESPQIKREVERAVHTGLPIIPVRIPQPWLCARELAGMTLVAIARKDGFEVFTHPRRISGELTGNVA